MMAVKRAEWKVALLAVWKVASMAQKKVEPSVAY